MFLLCGGITHACVVRRSLCLDVLCDLYLLEDVADLRSCAALQLSLPPLGRRHDQGQVSTFGSQMAREA